MKKKIINLTILTIFSYIFVYLSYMFIEWKFINPFQWIVNLPTYTLDMRISIFLTLFIYFLCVSIYLFDKE